MNDKLEEYGARLAACCLSDDWFEAENVLREIREAVGDELAEFWSYMVAANRLESEGDLTNARDIYAALRLCLEDWGSDIEENTRTHADILAIKHAMEFRELSVLLQIGGHSENEREQIEAKAQQIRRAVWDHRQTRVLEKLEASDQRDILKEPFAQMLLRSPLGPAIFDFMNMVTQAPMMLSRPNSLKIGFWGMIESAVSDMDFEANFVAPWLRQQGNRRQLALQQHANCTGYLMRSERARAMHRLFCDSWRRGSTYERHLAIREKHIAGGERLLEGFAEISRHMHRADQASHPEEKSEHLANAIHALVEYCYGNALIALYRLEFNRDDLARVPQHARQLGVQLTQHWQKHGHVDRLQLVNMDALIIRNAVAHHHRVPLPRGRVRFDSKSQNGNVDSTAELSVEEIRACFESLLILHADIVNAFSFIFPPTSRNGLVPMRW